MYFIGCLPKNHKEHNAFLNIFLRDLCVFLSVLCVTVFQRNAGHKGHEEPQRAQRIF